MDTCCNHKSNHKGPRERGLFVAGSGFSLSRRAYMGWLGAAWLGLQQSAYASSFDDFFRAIAADSESDLVALALRNFDLNTRDERMEPPLVMALRLGSLKAFNFLVSRPSVDVEARNSKDESPLMMAALKAYLAQCQVLIKRGAHVNKTGWAPLHYACSNATEKALPVVQLLLDAHAYIDAESPNRSTPLMMAAMYGHEKLAPLLLESGADATLRNEQGLSALDFAHRAGRTSLAEQIAQRVRLAAPKGKW